LHLHITCYYGRSEGAGAAKWANHHGVNKEDGSSFIDDKKPFLLLFASSATNPLHEIAGGGGWGGVGWWVLFQPGRQKRM